MRLRDLYLHVENKLELGLKLRIVDFEHGFHKFFLVDVLIIVLIHDFEKPLA